MVEPTCVHATHTHTQVRFELCYLGMDPTLSCVTLWRDPEYLAKFQGRQVGALADDQACARKFTQWFRAKEMAMCALCAWGVCVSIRGDRMGAVSYTHLTLPTIYSV